MSHGYSQGIPLKKKFGQHFLRDNAVIESIINAVPLTSTSSVFEIGCGDGVLTKAILKTPIQRLWVFEIDADWVEYIQKNVVDQRLTVSTQNILDLDFAIFEPHAPWILLSNLPYQVTFPILHMLYRNRHLLQEGVIMIQEEVAQKILKKSGRGYGLQSLFFQYYFAWKKLNKVIPTSFFPPPKIYSRLLHFKPKHDVPPIPQEKEFWKFIKAAFHQPRRTLKNNLMQYHFDRTKIPEKTLLLRAQELSMQDFLDIWKVLMPEIKSKTSSELTLD